MRPRTRIEKGHLNEDSSENFNISMTHISIYMVFLLYTYINCTKIHYKYKNTNTKIKYNGILSHFIGFYNPLKFYTRWKTQRFWNFFKHFRKTVTKLHYLIRGENTKRNNLKNTNIFKNPVSSIRVHNPWDDLILICSPESDL